MAQRTCTVEGCGRKHVAKGYCGSHYNQILCPDRHPRLQLVCEECKQAYTTSRTNGRFCSLDCRDARSRRARALAESQRPRPKVASPRTRLRVAVEDGHPLDVLATIRLECTVGPTGCWDWSRRVSRDGYPQVMLGGRTYQVHRLSLEAHLGTSLGTQPAHHICANTKCVNPEHLQPVSHRENAAEMMARTWMEKRIRELEDALLTLDPSHPLLDQVSLATL